MIIGLIGMPNSGKTTLFNALTRSRLEVTPYPTGRAEPNLAVMEVGDPRVDRLAEMYRPKKVTRATVELLDFAGLSEGSAKDGGMISSLSMGMVKNTDALGLVVRCFEDDLMGAADPLQELGQIETELFLSDLLVAEKRLERIDAARRRGQKDRGADLEERVLQRAVEALGEDVPLRDLELNPDEVKATKSFHFLTMKPFFVVLNSSEDRFGKNGEVMEAIGKRHAVLEIAGSFEMELSRFEDPGEARLFMEEMGLEESARDRLTHFAYGAVGYISFFTVGPDEVRAWNLKKGQSAVEAAGTIHNDLARGFIRAECFTYDDLVEAGSEKAVRQMGRLRLEGKDYVVQDGDILNIRFSV